ncbi:hypothetical protein [Ornithinimicrobium sp. INDO-MA30-4]|uniref:hypothetical protein n=1 Tax=Ornithinimicrobium sp. INDO-MA30-4 TaxID=2908651 RepID=UPI002883010F|nr:hypothetical protein [Ornithinimicrobium sp. INDO-MA30-4]
MNLPLAIPSPDQAVWMLGPFPIRAYAFCILLGIVAAVVITSRRFIARGGTGEEIYDIAPGLLPSASLVAGSIT